MATGKPVIVRPVGNRIRITSTSYPRFCVEAESKEKALALAVEAVRYIDSVEGVRYKPGYEVELLCA